MPHDFCYQSDYECFRCGHHLKWDNDFMASDLGLRPDDTDLEDDYMAVVMTCPHCGASYEVYDTPPECRQDYPYYQEQDEED